MSALRVGIMQSELPHQVDDEWFQNAQKHSLCYATAQHGIHLTMLQTQKSSVENVMNSYAHLGLISQSLCTTENVYLELITYNNNLEVDLFIVSAYRWHEANLVMQQISITTNCWAALFYIRIYPSP